ncbi:MAG: glycosyltransferase family 2 protein [Bradyrhizobiaceae bacterium]|nr:MAG: glycosyltransferase family 2 protein [Bradyrhizobiaceae bacterium]
MEPPSGKSELAVIIPTFNRAQSVGKTIDSVLSASLSAVEIVVVDDGSTDRTPDVLGAYDGKSIKVIKLPKREGGNHARNVGAAASSAPILAFLDSDDTFDASRPARLIEFYRAHPEIDAVLDSFVVERRGKRRDAIQPSGSFDQGRLTDLLITHAIPLTNSTVSVRRKAFDAIGGYDVTLHRHQDRDFLLRLSAGSKIYLGSGKDVLKVQSADSISRQGPDSVGALAAVVARHPEFRAPCYHDLLGYLAVRGILKLLIAGHLADAYGEIRALQDSDVLGRSFWDCLLHYRSGRNVRAAARAAAFCDIARSSSSRAS